MEIEEVQDELEGWRLRSGSRDEGPSGEGRRYRSGEGRTVNQVEKRVSNSWKGSCLRPRLRQFSQPRLPPALRYTSTAKWPIKGCRTGTKKGDGRPSDRDLQEIRFDRKASRFEAGWKA